MVVARGVPAGDDGCVFPGPVEELLVPPGASVTTTTMPDCTVVVTQLGAADGSQLERPFGVPVPAVDEAASVGQLAPATAGDDAVQHVVDDLAATAEDPMDPRWAYADNTVSDSLNHYVSDVRFEIRYDRNQRTGELHNVVSPWSSCIAESRPLPVGGPSDLLATNAVLWCAKHLTRVGPDTVEMNASGVYNYSVAGMEQVRYRLRLRAIALRSTTPNYVVQTCPVVPEVISGSWPQGWRSACQGNEGSGPR